MAETSINLVANYLLIKFRESGDCLTNLKLQKLVYYSQAWYLALYDKPLFDNKFEAWVHGPVNRGLYDRFKDYKWNTITEDIQNPELLEQVKNHLEEIIKAFGDETAYSLERMVHHEEPWMEARGGLSEDALCSNIISEDTMKRYYRNLANENKTK